MPETRYYRPYEEVREILLERTRQHRNPMEWVTWDDAVGVLNRLSSLDRDSWADEFCRAAEPYWQAAEAAEARGDLVEAQKQWLSAFGLLRVARYPAPNSPRKKEAYRLSQTAFLKVGKQLDPPVERVEMPFKGTGADPSAVIVGYLRRPRRSEPMPIVVQWGGIDSFKEERKASFYLEAQFAVMAIDMPGVGDAPIPGSERGEELWDGILDWIANEPGLDASRVALVGSSTGGYWANKLAHTHRRRLRAVVNHGGPSHYAFQSDWILRASHGEYPLELAETLASAFGRSTFEEWMEYAPRLSLLDQGILDQPSAPLLCVNGRDDSIFPIRDIHLLLEHGSPKTVRIYPGGHMGHGPDLMPTIVHWLSEHLNP